MTVTDADRGRVSPAPINALDSPDRCGQRSAWSAHDARCAAVRDIERRAEEDQDESEHGPGPDSGITPAEPTGLGDLDDLGRWGTHHRGGAGSCISGGEVARDSR